MVNKLFMSTPRATGDHIICNGLYRYFSEKYDFCVFPVKKSIYLNVKSMLNDLDNIQYIVYPDRITRRSTHVASYLFNKLDYDVVKFAWDGEDFPSKIPMTWDKNIYHQFNLNFDMRWEKFFAPRNMNKENELFDLLGCKAGQYAFVHEDRSRNFNVNSKYINSDLEIVKSNPNFKNFSIFDYRKVLENAAEIHCIEGSFSALVESINLEKPLFAHRYARPEAIKNSWHEYSYRCKWKIIVDSTNS
jgi:hypothetical protein